MGAPRTSYAERQQALLEEARSKSRTSLRMGALGVVLLFASGLGVWLVTDYAVAFLVGMVLGIVLILYAFLLVRGSVQVFKTEDRTKIL